jgi:hypothetical protein
MDWLLFLFGWSFVIFALALVVLPYILGKGDLITSWNLFMIGSANFLGISTAQVGARGYALYSQYTAADSVRFVAGAIVLFGVACPTYYFYKLPRRYAATHFNRWANQDGGNLIVLAFIALGLSLMNFFYFALPGIAPLMGFIGIHASLFALVFAATSWSRRPWSIPMFFLTVVTWITAAAITVNEFGRQDFLSVIFATFICFYWVWLRFKAKKIVMLWVAAGAALALIGVTGMSAYRFQSRDPSSNIFSSGLNAIEQMPEAFSSDNAQSLLGAGITDASLGAVDIYTTEGQPTKPFFTIWWVVTSPIPRVFWDDKPRSLGDTLPFDIGYAQNVHSFINFGPGIVAHGFQEGGIHMLIFYGFLIGALFRLFDEVLARHSNNAIMLGMFCSGSGTLVAFYRGDLGLYVVLLSASVIIAVVFNFIGRSLFGTTYSGMEGMQSDHDQPMGGATADATY